MLQALILLTTLARDVDVVPGSVQKVSQVTGETDRQLKRPTDNQTETKYGLRGTDLGTSFEHRGKLVFLFGDTQPNGGNTPDRPFDGDSVAISGDRNPEDGLSMDFVTASDGKYLAVHVPGVSLKGFEVPTGGFSDGQYMYGYYTTDAQFPPQGVKMGRSVLIRSKDAKTWELVYSWSTDKFINISPFIVDAGKTPGLPIKKGRALLLWASGAEYRRSDVCLAFIPLDKVTDKSQIRYWAGPDKWSADEKDAAALFHHPVVGELSVAWCKQLGRWLMLYNSGNPRGIVMRTAEQATGPWSDVKVLYDPWRDDGYGKFIHIDWRSKKVDEVQDPGRENDFGGEYGPYMIPKFFKGDKKEATIYFLMSTWNPYNVVLMRAKLKNL